MADRTNEQRFEELERDFELMRRMMVRFAMNIGHILDNALTESDASLRLGLKGLSDEAKQIAKSMEHFKREFTNYKDIGLRVTDYQSIDPTLNPRDDQS